MVSQMIAYISARKTPLCRVVVSISNGSTLTPIMAVFRPEMTRDAVAGFPLPGVQDSAGRSKSERRIRPGHPDLRTFFIVRSGKADPLSSSPLDEFGCMAH
jgi:hypothetical protein